MQVVDIGLSEIDAFSVQYARAFKPRGFRSQLKLATGRVKMKWTDSMQLVNYCETLFQWKCETGIFLAKQEMIAWILALIVVLFIFGVVVILGLEQVITTTMLIDATPLIN